jgi:hypothetical protein
MSLEKELEERCFNFPRFYFLNREQLIETLSYIRDSRKYLNTVRLCFPGIHELVYRLPKSAITSIINQNKKSTDSILEPQDDDKLSQQQQFDEASYNTKFNFDIYGIYINFIFCFII